MDLVEGQSKCVKRAYAGTVLGVVMGGFASLASGLQAHGGKLVTVMTRDAFARRAIVERTGRTMGALGIWSGLYQTTRCVLDERKVKDPENTAMALTVSAFPFLAIKVLRSEAPWVVILFALDLYHRPSTSTS